MSLKELALVLFTILTQMTVGSYLVLGAVHYYAVRKKGMEAADRLSDKALLILVPVLALAMLISLLHLGHLAKAPLAVANVATSWLSREIVFTVLFGCCAVLFVFLQYRKIGAFRLRNVIAWITGVVGLGLVYSMSRIYMIPTQPAWNSVATPVAFFTTTLLLGSLAMGTAFIVNYSVGCRKDPDHAGEQCEVVLGALKGIALFSIALLGIEFIEQPLYLGYLATAGAAAQASAAQIVQDYQSIFILRLLLVFLGAGIFGVFLYKNATARGSEVTVKYLIYSAFSLVLVAEVLGRFLFYMSEYRIGV